MFEIRLPPEDVVRRIQQEETAYYWSACAEGVLRKHGLIDVSVVRGGGAPTGYPVVARGTPGADLFDGPGLFEGPLAPEALRALGLRAVPRAARSLVLSTEECPRVPVAYPQIDVRQIPRDRKEKSEPYPYVSRNPLWNAAAVRCQELSADGGAWRPVLWASLDGAGDPGVVGLSDGRRLALGLPALDLAGCAYGFPPLEAGYYRTRLGCDAFSLGVWLADQLVEHALRAGHEVLRADRWPRGCWSAFTVRHDYDRPAKDEIFARLLDYYRQGGLKSSWGFMAQAPNVEQMRGLVAAGHEVNLHTVAGTADAFAVETLGFERTLGRPALGYTAHGGTGSAGYLGQIQFAWAEEAGMLYGEMASRLNGLPHLANRADGGVPRVTGLVLPCCHHSLDAGTRPAAHHLDFVLTSLPRWLERGAHVVLMNHPDIHFDQLRQVIETVDLARSWHATLAEVAAWCDATKLRARVERSGAGAAIRLAAPNPAETSFTLRRPDGTESRVPCPAGATCAALA